MRNVTTLRLRTGAVALVVACLAVAAAIPANAASSTISCGGSSEAITNGNQSGGNSISITTNNSLNCAGVGHMAKTNVNGQLLWSSGPTLVWNKTYNSRTYYGAMHTSRHYHNGSYDPLYY